MSGDRDRAPHPFLILPVDLMRTVREVGDCAFARSPRLMEATAPVPEPPLTLSPLSTTMLDWLPVNGNQTAGISWRRHALTPREAIAHGHEMLVEAHAGRRRRFRRRRPCRGGAKDVVKARDEVFASADMIVKVKEPQAVERKRLREGQLCSPICATCTSGETVTDDRGRATLLAPMSEVEVSAPRVGAWTLQKANGGRGVLWAECRAWRRRRCW